MRISNRVIIIEIFVANKTCFNKESTPSDCWNQNKN